jgi:hypothetical protein
VEANRDAARGNGWLVPHFAHPDAYVVLLWDGRLVRLLPDGTYDEVFGEAVTP